MVSPFPSPLILTLFKCKQWSLVSLSLKHTHIVPKMLPPGICLPPREPRQSVTVNWSSFQSRRMGCGRIFLNKRWCSATRILQFRPKKEAIKVETFCRRWPHNASAQQAGHTALDAGGAHDLSNLETVPHHRSSSTPGIPGLWVSASHWYLQENTTPGDAGQGHDKQPTCGHLPDFVLKECPALCPSLV